MATIKYTGVGNIRDPKYFGPKGGKPRNNVNTSSPTQTKIQIIGGTGVRYGNTTYTGNSIVPNSGGLTANQIQQETLRMVKAQNPNINAGSYNLTFTQEQTQQIATQLNERIKNEQQIAAATRRKEQIAQATNKFQQGATRTKVTNIETGKNNFERPAKAFMGRPPVDRPSPITVLPQQKELIGEPSNYITPTQQKIINNMTQRDIDKQKNYNQFLKEQRESNEPKEIQNITIKENPVFKKTVEPQTMDTRLSNVFNFAGVSPRLTDADKQNLKDNIIRMATDVAKIPNKIGEFKQSVQPYIPEFIKEGKQYIKSGEMMLDVGTVKNDVNQYFIPESVRQAKADIKGSASVFHEWATETAIPFRKGVDKTIQVVEGAILPTFLNEQFYLPDNESKKTFNKYIEESNITPVDIRDGKISFNTNPSLYAGGELRNLAEEGKVKFTEDVAKIEKLKQDAEYVINTPQFKKREAALSEYEKRLEEIRNRPNITQADVDEYNREYATYKKLADSVRSGYDLYRYKMELANETIDYVNKGMVGSGWKMLEKAVETEKVKTGRDATVATLALKGGMSAYNVEKTALAFQIGGGVIGKTAVGSVIGRGLATPIIGQSSIGSIVTSTPVVLGTAGTLGVGSGLREYQKSGNLGYALASGIGAAGAFTSIIALPSAFPTPKAKNTKYISKKDLDEIAKDKAVANADVYKYDDKNFRVTTYETQKSNKFISSSGTEYDVQIIDGKPVVQDGRGYTKIVNLKNGQVYRDEPFSFKGSGEVITDKKLLGIIERMQTMKGKLTISLGKDIVNKDFMGLGLKQQNLLYSMTDDFDAARIKVKLEMRAPELIQGINKEGVPETKGLRLNYDVASKKYVFSPKSIAEVKTPTADELQLKLGMSNTKLGYTVRRGDPFTDFLTKGFAKPESLSGNIKDFLKAIPDTPPKYTFDIGKRGKSLIPTMRNFNPFGAGGTPSPPITSGNEFNLPRLETFTGNENLLLSSFGQQASVTALQSQNLIYPIFDVSPYVSLSTLSGNQNDDIQKFKFDTLKLNPLKTKNISEPIIKTKDGQDIIQDSTPKIDSGTRSGQGSISELVPEVVVEPVIAPTLIIPRPRPPTPRSPQSPTFQLPKVDWYNETKKKTYQGYYAEYQPEGSQKFERLNKQPETLGSALSTMARKVDKFRSTVGRIVAAKPIVTKKARGKSPIKDNKDTYYKRNKDKFRTYSLMKGNKGMIQSGTFIEKEEYRNDSPLERVKKKVGKFRL